MDVVDIMTTVFTLDVDQKKKEIQARDVGVESTVECTLTFDAPSFSIELFHLLQRWMDAERVALNRSAFQMKQEENKNSAYIKQLFPEMERDRFLQHFLLAARSYRGDYFNAYDPRKHGNKFLQDYLHAVPQPIPTTMFIGNEWALEERYLSREEKYLPFQPTSFPWKEKQFTFEVKRFAWSTYQYDGKGLFQVRNLKSPFPGYICGLDAYMNLEEVYYSNSRPLTVKVTFKSTLTTSLIEELSTIQCIPCPANNATAMAVWLEQSILFFIQYCQTHGFYLKQ